MTDNPSIMETHEFHIHGGRLHAARLCFPDAPLPWLDLSTGINPNAYPYEPTDVNYNALPDPARLQALLNSAATAFGLAHPSLLTAVPGSDSGLRALAFLLGKRRVALAEPTYSSHRLAWSAIGADIIAFDCARHDFPDADVFIIVNPNNPTGTHFSRDVLMNLATRQYQKGGYLIVDEAFVDCIDGLSLGDYIADVGPGSALILLRSFGKFYGLAGVRLGFIAASRNLINRLHIIFGDWPVSVAAIAVGIKAYQDHNWQRAMRTELTARAAKLDQVLEQAQLNPIGGTPLFRLGKSNQALQIFTHLAQHGILTRPFADNPTWLRFGLPKDNDFDRVKHALRMLP
jgi:cobalamin biosynthetic protein CobC